MYYKLDFYLIPIVKIGLKHGITSIAYWMSIVDG